MERDFRINLHHAVFLFVFAALLAACTVTPSDDPSLMPRTEAEIEIQRQRAALDAERERLALQGTQTIQAIEVEGTRAAMVAIAEATDTAQGATAIAVQATATAIQARATQEAMRQEFRGYVDIGWFSLPFCGAAILVLIVLGSLWRFSDYFLDSYIRKSYIGEYRVGTVAWIETEGKLLPVVIGGVLTPPRLPQIAPRINSGGDADGVYRLTASGSVLASPVAQSPGVRELALNILWQAQQIDGFSSLSIPGWRRLQGVSSSQWQRAMAALRAAGVEIETTQDGTYLRGVTVGDLHYRIETGALRVRPTTMQDDV